MQDNGVDNRLTIRDAALVLGVSEGAVRKRVDRGTLDHVRGEDGRIYVFLPDGVPAGETASNTHESSILISEMRSRIDFLEGELQRKDAILMNMTETMKAITAPPEPRDSSQTPPQEAGKGETEQEKRSWWQRFFGLE